MKETGWAIRLGREDDPQSYFLHKPIAPGTWAIVVFTKQPDAAEILKAMKARTDWPPGRKTWVTRSAVVPVEIRTRRAKR